MNEPARPSVRLEGVTKRFGDFPAVRELDLDVERGEFFTLLGPSGCGKTTTLRMVAGFEEPSAGRILLDGADVEGLPPFKRPTNTVFQSYALFPHLSVEENVAFGLRRRGVPREEARRHVAAELELVGLAREAKRKPRQLSGGQQQRVALARALVNRPAVLLLDEPLGSLDRKLRTSLQLELKRIQREVGITFLYVTHDQEEALTMSDRIAVMNQGLVEQMGSPEDVYERPSTEFVAGFIGVSNLMPGRVESVNGNDVSVRLDAGPLVRARIADGLHVDDRCHAVVRPEKLRVVLIGEPAPSDRPSVEGVVESAAFLGTATQMIVKLTGDVPITVLVPNTDEAERQRLPGAGARVRLSWAPENTHVLTAHQNGRGGGPRLSNSRDRDIERLVDQLLQAGVSRRTLLHGAGAGAIGLSLAGFLAACGGNGNGGNEVKVIPKGEIADQLNFSNWPLYIDRAVLKDFKEKNGTTVKYTEEINDNVEFFGKVRQQYEQGRSGGRDIHVVTDWLANRMKILGYVQKLDKSAMPNVVKNIEPAVAGPDFDPKREFSVPWQSGQVLLIFRKDKVGDITSINELFDPKLKGKVTMLTEMRDTVGSVLLADKIEPEKASLDQVMTAIDKIRKASQDGQIRKFTGNEYTRDILKGDSHAIIGWSGDAVQLTVDSKNVGFNQPKEGFMIFTDSMQVPVGAPHAFTAEKFMDFVYDPEVQATITAYVNYVPPVKGVKEILAEKDPALAESELIFPDLSNAHNFKSFPIEQEQEIDTAFQAAIGV